MIKLIRDFKQHHYKCKLILVFLMHITNFPHVTADISPLRYNSLRLTVKYPNPDKQICLSMQIAEVLRKVQNPLHLVSDEDHLEFPRHIMDLC